MQDRTLIRTGAAGAIFAAICCFTPLLVVALPAVGLAAWLAGADYVLFPLLAVSLGVLGFGLYRRHARAADCCETENVHTEGLKR